MTTEKTFLGMKIVVRDDLPPGEVRLVGPPRIVNGLEVRDYMRITGIEVGGHSLGGQHE